MICVQRIKKKLVKACLVLPGISIDDILALVFHYGQCDLYLFYQVKATAENVDEAVRELPDANLVRYSFFP